MVPTLFKKAPEYPLVMSCKQNTTSVTKALLSLNLPWPADCVDDALVAALHFPEALKLLLSHGLDPRKSEGIVEKVVWAKNGDSLAVLVRAGCDIEEHGIARYGHTSETPLYRACQYGLEDAVAQLLAAGAAANARATTHPLYGAISRPSILRRLLAAGADVAACPALLTWAVKECGHAECVEQLADAGADVNECEFRRGYELPTTPLCEAVMYQAELVPVLLLRGADPNLNGQRLPVVAAAGLARPESLEALLRAGADPNRAGKDRSTDKDYALIEACSKGLTENVRLLLKHGADVEVTNAKGVSPMDAAAEGGHEDLVMLLLDGGE